MLNMGENIYEQVNISLKWLHEYSQCVVVNDTEENI